MIIQEAKTPVFGNTSNMTSHKIEMSAKAIQILSDGLYTHKIRAFIRELCCNAVDGHIARQKSTADAPKYFDVTPPSMLDLQFRLRDYGIGLSEEQIYELFNTYFASSKEGSNDCIGGFGLGSKSPFAYIKNGSFSITSYHGGVKKVYNSFKKDGIPSTVKVFEEPSSESTGVEIVIPIESSDVKEVLREMRYVFCTFDKDGYLPNVIGYDDFKFMGDDIKTHEYTSYGFSSYYVYAVSGGVAYMVPPNVYNNTLFFNLKREVHFLEFNIGEIEPAPSREQLQLTDNTLNALKSKIKEEEQKIIDEIQKYCDSNNNIRKIYNHIISTHRNRVWEYVSGACHIKGKKLRDCAHELGRSADYNNKNYKMLLGHAQADTSIPRYISTIGAYYNYNTFTSRKNIFTKRYHNVSTARCEYDVRYQGKFNAFIVDNSDKNNNKKIKALIDIGVIPRNLYGYSVMVFDLNNQGLKDEYLNAVKIKSKRNRRVSIHQCIQSCFSDIAKTFDPEDVQTWNVQKLYERHIDDIKEFELKHAPVKVPKEKVEVKNCLEYTTQMPTKEKIRLLAKDIEDISEKVYYVPTKNGCAFDESNEGVNFNVENHDFHMLLKHNTHKINRIIIIPFALVKAAKRNPNLIKIDNNVLNRLYEKLKRKHLKLENLAIDIRNPKINTSYVPELYAKFNLVQNGTEEMAYIIKRSKTIKDQAVVSKIKDFSTDALNKIENNINEFKAKNPLIYNVMTTSITLDEESIKELRKILNLKSEV